MEPLFSGLFPRFNPYGGARSFPVLRTLTVHLATSRGFSFAALLFTSLIQKLKTFVQAHFVSDSANDSLGLRRLCVSTRLIEEDVTWYSHAIGKLELLDDVDDWWYR